MKILALGDITDSKTVLYLKERLWGFRKENKIDFVIANGENAGFIFGVSPDQAGELFSAGVDVITGGNHTMQNKLIYPLLSSTDTVLRPINYPAEVCGAGYTIQDCNGYRLMIINALGNMHIEPQLDNPIPYIERALNREEGKYDFAILDFHAEATGEKGIVARYFDGRLHIVFGTHTHVQTADERILPKGTAFISDIGMCGPKESILGIDPESAINKYLTHLPSRFCQAEGEIEVAGVVFTLDESVGRVTRIERVRF
jgi:metallophosphoesterase (TIGR00282 family)